MWTVRTFLRSRAVLVGLVIGVPLSMLFLWLAFRNADLGDVWSAIITADPFLVGLAVCTMTGVYTGQAVRWRAIARTPTVSTATFGEMVVSGLAVNNVVPGRVGDLFRARWLQMAARIPGGRALATVVIDRGFDVLALVLFLGISLPLVTSATWLVRIAVGGLVLLALLGLMLGAARVYTRRRARERRGGRRLVRRFVRDTLEGLAEPLGRRRGVALVGLSLVTWSMWAVTAWLVARGVGIELSALEAIFVTAVINLGVAMPSSPGFIGTYQWLSVSALALFGVGSTEALAFAVILQTVWYVPTTLVGGGLLVRRAVFTITTAPVSGAVVEAHDA